MKSFYPVAVKRACMAIAAASVVAACGTQESGKPASQQDVPAIIQNWGFNFADYSEATGKAGDMLIKGVTPPTFTGSTAAKDNAMYRFLIGPIGLLKSEGIVEPQMAFYLPLGTPVISMVNGTV